MTFLYLGKMEHNRIAGKPNAVIIEKLGFDDGQIKEYQALIQEHSKDSRRIFREIGESKNELYKDASKDNAQINDSIAEVIGNKFKELESIHFDHFVEIRKICKGDQIAKFDELSSEFQSIFNMRSKPQRHNRH